MEAYILDWANMLVRWLHLITGVAWIGASFYFVMLDNSLTPPAKASDRDRGMFGELWAVHGGGFYLSQKYLTGPTDEPLPQNLHWSKWEAYTTWLSGMGLLIIIYWFGASTYLIDLRVMTLTPVIAITISGAFIVVGWLIYNALCQWLRGRENLLAAIIFILIMASAWALFHIFSPRAAFLHVGAMMGTIMVANVFFQIIPGQKKMLEEIRAGLNPDPTPGIIGKQRSVHNTYFTLPVLFIMISAHYPMTYSHTHGWIVLGVIMMAGVFIRQFFVLRHRGQKKWWLPAIGVAMLLALAVALAPQSSESSVKATSYTQIKQVLDQRCLPCHAAQPTQPGFAQPPKGVILETPEQVKQHGLKIAETVNNRYMPLGNLTKLTEDERGLILSWFTKKKQSEPK